MGITLLNDHRGGIVDAIYHKKHNLAETNLEILR